MPIVNIERIVYTGSDERVLKQISKELKSINIKLDKIMAKQEKFDAILARLDAATTDIAGDFQTFLEEFRAGTVSDASIATFESNVAKLEALAASKENPVPEEPETPEEPTDEEPPVEEQPTEDETV